MSEVKTQCSNIDVATSNKPIGRPTETRPWAWIQCLLTYHQLKEMLNLKTNIMNAEIFNASFKFKLYETVRHISDQKSFGNPQINLFIVGRELNEVADGAYEIAYSCRIIGDAQSGRIGEFHEKELISVEEHDILTDERRKVIRAEAKKDILDSFSTKIE